jgi:hypothetical protein
LKLKIKRAPYNPRTFGKENRKALKKSLSEFNDISGITINESTGNIVAGNHRWEELESKHGKLTLQNIYEDRYLIMDAKNTYTGFMARVVNWSLNKEKQANIIANSHHVEGEWSSDLQTVLKEIALETDADLMDELKLTDMVIDMSVSDADLDLADDKKREKTQENYDLEDDESTGNSEVRHIISTFKITLPSEHKEEAMDAILTALSSLPFYDKVTITE